MNNENNLWRSSSKMDIKAPPLSEDDEVDLAIIGGGFTGHSAALEAARRGAKVVLLEAETFGHGGSGRNVGLVNPGLWVKPEEVLQQMGNTAGKRLLNTLAKGPAKVWKLIREESIDCEATPKGTLHLAHAPSGLKDLEKRFRQGKALGWPIELLDTAETARRTGSHAFHGALFDPRAGTIQPLSYARGLATAALRAGARLHEHSPVDHLEQTGDGWELRANGYRITAKCLLVATNAYMKGIGVFSQPTVVPAYYFQLATRPMPDHLRAEILADGEGCWDTGLIMSSFRTDKAGRMIVGAVGNLDAVGKGIHTHWAKHKLAKVYPQLASLEFEYSWCGRIGMTNDHLPKIIEFGPNAYSSLGYSGRGICPGTVFGTQIAIALLENREDELPMAPVLSHRERFKNIRETYYETGAILNHAVKGVI